MNYEQQLAIVIFRQHGVTQRVVSTVPGAIGVPVIDVEDGHVQPARYVIEPEPEDELSDLISQALESLRANGYGMAAGLAASRLLEIERMSGVAARDVKAAAFAVIEELRRNVEVVDRGQKLDPDSDAEPEARRQLRPHLTVDLPTHLWR